MRLKRSDEIPKFAAGSKFGKYGPVREDGTREAKVVQKDWKHFETLWDSVELSEMELNYAADNLFRKIVAQAHVFGESNEIDQRLLTEFIFFLQTKTARFKLVPTKAGLLISAISRLCREESLEMDLDPIAYQISEIGYANRKNLKISGGLIKNAMTNMASGKVEINGPVYNINDLRGGEIVVNGNVDSVGAGMEGGSIIINGDVSAIHGVMDGSITVNGNLGEIGEISGGAIRVKGKCSRISRKSIWGGFVRVKDEVILGKGEP
jgi:hypothetical protein